MSRLHLASRAEVPLLIAFADLTRFMVQAGRVTDLELADTLDAFYERIAERAVSAGGTLVKFIGDAAMMVFPEDAVDPGVEALLHMKEETDAYFTARGWECRLVVKAHFGSVVAGPFGAANDKHLDVLGNAVNAAARLDSVGVAISADAFRKLSPSLRKRFKKHTPTITYIRAEDPHRFRRK
jgi:class 3 adenylate cyclase